MCNVYSVKCYQNKPRSQKSDKVPQISFMCYMYCNTLPITPFFQFYCCCYQFNLHVMFSMYTVKCYQKSGLITEVKNSGKVQQISVPSPHVYLGEALFDLQVMPDHANSFADRRSADVLWCSVLLQSVIAALMSLGQVPVCPALIALT